MHFYTVNKSRNCVTETPFQNAKDYKVAEKIAIFTTESWFFGQENDDRQKKNGEKSHELWNVLQIKIIIIQNAIEQECKQNLYNENPIQKKHDGDS